MIDECRAFTPFAAVLFPFLSLILKISLSSGFGLRTVGCRAASSSTLTVDHMQAHARLKVIMAAQPPRHSLFGRFWHWEHWVSSKKGVSFSCNHLRVSGVWCIAILCNHPRITPLSGFWCMSVGCGAATPRSLKKSCVRLHLAILPPARDRHHRLFGSLAWLFVSVFLHPPTSAHHQPIFPVIPEVQEGKDQVGRDHDRQ